MIKIIKLHWTSSIAQSDRPPPPPPPTQARPADYFARSWNMKDYFAKSFEKYTILESITARMILYTPVHHAVLYKCCLDRIREETRKKF